MNHRFRLFTGLLVFCLAAGGVVLCLGGCNRKEPARSVTVFSGSSAAPGAAVTDLADYRIAYYEAAAWAEEDAHGTLTESDEPFRMADYGPRGELPQEIRKPSIYVVFSQPVVPLAKLGEPIRQDDAGGLFTIDPPLEGVYRWYGSRLLSFEPETENLPQRSYKVTLSDTLRSLGGKPLEGEKSFSFETEGLSVLSCYLGDGEGYVSPRNAPPEEARNITLIFSYPVNLEEIGRWLVFHAGEKTWPFRVSRPARIEGRGLTAEQGVLVTLNEALPMDTEAKLTVLAGARSEPGWLGSKEDWNFTFHTLLPFRFDEIYVRSITSPHTREGDSIPITLVFSHPVDPAEAEQYFFIEGMPPAAAENIRVYGTSVVLDGFPLEYRHDYQVRISGDLKDLWGRPLGKAEQVLARVGEASSYVYTRNTGPRMLEGAFPPRVIWEAQNPLSLRFLSRAAAGPYERVPPESLKAMDRSQFPANSKRFFMENLEPYLGPGGRGSAAMAWDYEARSSWGKREVYRDRDWLTVQVTDMGITVRYGYNKVLVWVTRLSSGEPIAGARVELLEGTGPVREGLTDAQGLGVFEFPDGAFVARFTQPASSLQRDGSVGKGLRIRVSQGGGARAGGDQAEFIPNDSHNMWRFDLEATVSPFAAEAPRPVIFLFTDRGLYRPGETVTFRGIDRNLNRGHFEVYQGPYTIEVSSGGYQAPEIASIHGVSSGNGGSHGSFTLPADLDPGVYTIRYKRGEAAYALPFTVANFERARVALSLKFPDIPFYAGETLSARLSASYLAGGGLSGAAYSWYWTREPRNFNPGGDWQYWRFGPELSDGRSFVSRGEGTLGPDGSADISQVPLAEGVEGAAYQYRLETAVQDAARQEIAGRGSVTVHPASFYIAARLDPGTTPTATAADTSPSAWFLPAGSPAAISWALLSPEGEPYRGPENWQGELAYELVRYEWKQARQAGVGGRVNLLWERVETVEEGGTLELKGSGREGGREGFAGVKTFTPGQSGQWEIRLRGRDPRNRPVVTRFGFYVSGAGWVRWGTDDVDHISLSPDKGLYAPGETARILVRSPLPRGKYLLTLEREGILSEQIIELDGSARTIDIPINETQVPLVYVALSSYTIRSGSPQNSYYEPDLDKPKGVFGLAALRVDNRSRRYTIEITGSKGGAPGVYAPAEEAEVRLTVSQNGRPAPGVELTFMAVDRGVVDLIDYHVPDPLAYFYDPRNFPLGVRGADSRSLLIDPVTYALSDLQGGDAEDDAKLEERKDFRPSAVFEPVLVTGPDGTVTVKFRLPDSLTTYRCTALAAGLDAFGIAEQDLRVSAPLTAQAALPRKLRWRDTGQVSLILTNLTEKAVQASVSLAVEGTGAEARTVLAVDGGDTKTLTINPGASEEASFRVAAVGSGEARLVFTLHSPQVNERILRNITVDRPVLYETVTLAGNLGDQVPFIEEGVVLPSIIPEGTGSLSVSLSASRLARLKEAVGYLLDYPYGCLEQRTARLLPLISFAGHLDAFDLASPVENPQQLIEEELAELAKNKLSDGSYPYWPGGEAGNYYVSLRVAHIAALARVKGYALPPSLEIPKLLTYLSSSDYARRYVSRDPFLWGYALWVRAMHGEQIGGELSGFLSRGDDPGISGWAFAGLAALELGMRDFALSAQDRIRRFIRPGTQTLDLTDTYEQGANFWGSDTDRYALALMLYQALSPQDDMTTRLARALLERQRRGIWSNTASSFWAVLAFGRVADGEANTVTNLKGRLSLGGAGSTLRTPLVSGEFGSYGGAPLFRLFPFTGDLLRDLPRDTLLPLRIEREGSGDLYYTASLRYGVPAELVRPRDEGLGVFTETFDAEGNPVRDGRLIPGKTYTRRVLVSGSRDRTFVALRIPVPSGAEIVDAALVTSATVPPAPEEEAPPETGRFAAYARQYAPIRFILDDEIRFHWDYFPQGKAEVEFRFRAVMPGVYPTPPAQAECMYEEEVFGRGAGELVRIGT
ncbi:MAG: alpha-2-macroglobulin [Spirochaetaceae bacterium]|nr:alpha-2-macroglobulin [Spirochaetaceae bacterium]